MLIFFHEYRLDHPRFRGHARVAMIMALVVPLCSLIIADAIGWLNPWLWGGSGCGMALALALRSVLAMHRHQGNLGALGRRMVRTSASWFPYFFVLIQSAIASLIVLFVWFSATAMALPMPAYVHGLVVVMALLIPARRYITAHIQPGASYRYELWREGLRGTWHALAAILVTRVIIGITQAELTKVTQGTIAWQVMLWVPAALYIIFSTSMMIEHLAAITRDHRPAPVAPAGEISPDRL